MEKEQTCCIQSEATERTRRFVSITVASLRVRKKNYI